MMPTERLVVVIVLGVTSVLLALRTARRPSPVRPRLDLARVVLQLATAVGVIVLTHVAPIPWLGAAALAVGLTVGWVQGNQLDVTLRGARPMAVRSPVGMAVWVVALVCLQVASAMRSTGVWHSGQLIAWVSLGITAGVTIGRRGPLARATASATATFAATACLLVLVVAAVLLGTSRPDGVAGATSTTGEWVHSGPVAASMSTTAFTSFDHSPGFISAQVEADGYRADFTATYGTPPERVPAGGTVMIDVTVTGSVDGTVQQFSNLDVILVVDDRWTNDAVGVGVNCSQPIGDFPLTCTPPASSSGTFQVTLPTSGATGATVKVGIGALNCDCTVNWTYSWQDAASSTGGDPGVPTDDEITDDEITDEEWDAGGVAGTAAAAATVLIAVVETLGQGVPMRRRDDETDGPPWAPAAVPLPPPVAVATDALAATTLLEPPTTTSVGPSLEGTPTVEQVVQAATDSALLDQLGAIFDRMREWSDYLNRPLSADEVQAFLDALDRMASDPSAVSAQAALDRLAGLLDRNIAIGPLPGYVVAAMLRNPATSAEVITRIVVAAKTGGLSELGLIPLDVWRDITAARDAALERGEPFTFTDGLVAGAQGQAIGWVFDGAGRIVGPALGRGSGVGGQIGDTVEDMARARPRVGTIPAGTDDSFLRGLQPGDQIPLSRVGSAGYTAEQAAAIQRIAEREGVEVVARTTNIYDGTRQVIPKPELIKSKTISDLDSYLNPNLTPDDKGLVGLFEPQRPTLPPGHPDYDSAWARYDQRSHEWADYSQAIGELEDAGVVQVRGGVVHHVAPDGTLTPFAGDIDVVRISRNGVPVTGEEYERLARELRASPAGTQHGAEVNIVRDFIANRTAGLEPGTYQWTAARNQAEADARALFDKLNQGHLRGRETGVVFSADGITRAPQLTSLDSHMERVVSSLPPAPIDDNTIGGVGRAATSSSATDE